MLEGAYERVRWAESEITQTAIDGNHHRRLEPSRSDWLGDTTPENLVDGHGSAVLIDKEEASGLPWSSRFS